MSDRMTPIPFARLMEQVWTEYQIDQSIFGVREVYRHQGGKRLSLFGETLETPFGPAAGPHTQLAQNIIAAYAGGARFFELKTVQTLDGEDLPVSKPCILAHAEGYNVEWSTELTVPQAMDEYIKAWLALKLISASFGLGARDGFVFNMSVGYDLKGIQSPKIDAFIEGLKNAADTPVWRECMRWARENRRRFSGLTENELEAFEPRVCRGITLSTLHGCPPDEIERIATYLLREKHLNTFVKCNPTLLGYDFARQTMDALGYEEVVFDDHHFKADLQLRDAIAMFTRLQTLAQSQGLLFGLKLSNTFPVSIAQGELPGEEMYMSGKALWPLTIHLAQKLEHAFGGQIRVSYSGGADEENIAQLFDAGVWPITLATTLLKPGGYNRLPPMARRLAERPYQDFAGVDLAGLDALAEESLANPRYRRPLRPEPVRKNGLALPALDCFHAPCEDGCPLHQDISAYLELVEQGRYAEALAVICERNPLPFITGTLCAHHCMSRCARQQYEQPVQIRAAKLMAAEKGYDEFVKTLVPGSARPERVAVIGGGPAGMALSFFLARGGVKVTLFEEKAALGGVVRHVIPEFRIATEAIDRDAAMLKKLGVEIKLHERAETAPTLLENGYTHVALCCGAWAHTSAGIEGEVNALAFLEKAKRSPDFVNAGKHVVVIGGGNTAMDAARAAKRLPGVEDVTIVYRRTSRQMPAEEEELRLALEDGVALRELLSPAGWENGQLTCEVMRLGARDESGRRSPEWTGERVVLPADTVVSAIGEKVDASLMLQNAVTLDAKGRPTARRQSNGRLFVLGDALRGPATVAEAIADALETASELLGAAPEKRVCESDAQTLLAKRGKLCAAQATEKEFTRCLGCGAVCLNCVDTCPNRANVTVTVDGKAQVVHVDSRCNECGNCTVFCPWQGDPYKEKLTVFENESAFRASANPGFTPPVDGLYWVRWQGEERQTALDDAALPAEISRLMRETLKAQPWLA
ncbi:MAG: putative selenate reductase subunit YgfK [Eubacteriales bacterium]|nr:putative selenate reductase subunit YgfK [Eubacteriales bacterium]